MLPHCKCIHKSIVFQVVDKPEDVIAKPIAIEPPKPGVVKKPMVAPVLVAPGERTVSVDFYGRPVRFNHDAKLKRISDVHGSIFDYTADELLEMHAFHPKQFGDQFKGVPISTAQELAHLIQVKSHVHFYIELKNLKIWDIDWK